LWLPDSVTNNFAPTCPQPVQYPRRLQTSTAVLIAFGQNLGANSGKLQVQYYTWDYTRVKAQVPQVNGGQQRLHLCSHSILSNLRSCENTHASLHQL
jgi:hypothetical protein